MNLISNTSMRQFMIQLLYNVLFDLMVEHSCDCESILKGLLQIADYTETSSSGEDTDQYKTEVARRGFHSVHFLKASRWIISDI